MLLKELFNEFIKELNVKPRSSEEIICHTRRLSKRMNLQSIPFITNHAVNLFLYRRIYKEYLNEDVQVVQSLNLPSAEYLWYKNVIPYIRNSYQVDLCAISIPMIYNLNPTMPVSCALLVCLPTDDIGNVFEKAAKLVQYGVGIGIEMLSCDAKLITEMERLDKMLTSLEGKRDNFVAVNVLACHPAIKSLISFCFKSGGLFFKKINLGLWWSKEFLTNDGRVVVVNNDADLSLIKRCPLLAQAPQWIDSSYLFIDIFNAKFAGGVPYLLHIEG